MEVFVDAENKDVIPTTIRSSKKPIHPMKVTRNLLKHFRVLSRPYSGAICLNMLQRFSGDS